MAEDVEIRVGVDDRASAVLKRVAATTEEIDRAAREAGKGDDKAYVAAQRRAALLEESARSQLFALKLDEGASREQRLKVALVRSELDLASKLAQIKAQGLPAYQEELEIERAKLAAIRAQERLQADDKSALAKEGQDRTDAFNEEDAAKRTKNAQQLALATGAVTIALGAAAAASAVFVGALDATYTKASEAAAVYLDYKRALDQVEDSLYRAGDAGEDAAARLGTLNAETARLARLSDFDQPELLKSLSKIIDLSGQAENAQKGLGLAVAISTKRGEDLDEVSEKVAQALKGEIAALEDLTPLTGQQADALRKIESDSERAKKAVALLEAQYGGLLEGQDRTYLATRALQVAQDELVGSIGQVVTESGALAVVQESATRIIDRLTAYVSENRGELKLWLLEGVDRGVVLVQQFTGVLEKNADVIAGGVTVIRLGAGALGIYLNVLQIVSKAMVAFSSLLVSGVIGGLERLIGVAESLASSLPDAVGKDLADNLRIARDTAGEVSEKFADISAAAALSAADDVGDITAQFEAMGRAIDQTDLVESKLRAGLKIIGDEAATTRSEIAKLKQEVDKPTKPRKDRPPEAPKKPAIDDVAKRTAQEAARLRLQALDTQDKEIRAALEYQAKLKEIEGQQLKGAQGELARRQAALDAEKSLDEVLNDRARAEAIALRLQTAGVEARTKAQQQRAVEVEFQAKVVELRREEQSIAERQLKMLELETERRLALREIEAAAIEEQAEGWARVASGVTSAASGAEGYGKMVGEGFGAVVGGLGEIQKLTGQVSAGIITAAAATEQGLAVAGSSVSTFAGALGASAAEQAGILALFETASAIASFAVGDFLGGGQHLVAAGLYTAVAATGGASAPSASASGGGATGGGQAAPRGGRAQEDTSRRGAQVLAEEIAAAMGQSSAPVTVYYDYRGAVMADSPAGQRRLFEAAAGGGRQVGVDLDDLKVNRQGRKP